MDIIDISSGLVTNYPLSSFYFAGDSGIKTITVSENITVNVDESIIIYALASVVPLPTFEIDFDTISSDLEISETVVNSVETTIDAMPVYEALEMCGRHIFDTQYPIYTEFFGRLDTPYNIAGDFYLSENQLRFLSITSGLNIRGELLSDENTPLTISFEKLFQSLTSMYNLGYTFETIDDFLRLRIEEYSFFFEDSVSLDISSRISIFDIESEVMSELAYSSLKSGYRSFDYESINGRGEYNVNNERTSKLNVDGVFDNVSDIRADTKEISDLLTESIKGKGSTDSKADNSIFAFKSQRNTTDPDIDWDAETDENIAVENFSSLFDEGSLNLYITPTRNLKRQGNKIKSALIKALSSSYLRFQTADKNQTLETTGEGYTVTENEDLLVNDLEDPIYRPIKHKTNVIILISSIY